MSTTDCILYISSDCRVLYNGFTAMQKNHAATLFYDGDCSLCKKVISVIKKVDAKKNIRMINLWQIKEHSEFSDLDALSLSRELHLLTKEGKIYTGFFAFRWISKMLPVFSIFYLLSFFPGASFLGQKVYKLVSDNRHILGCSSCGKLFCRIHPAQTSRDF